MRQTARHSRCYGAEQAHPGHIRLHRRQFDAIVDLLWGLRDFGKRGFALRAGHQPRINDAVRVGCNVRPTPGRLLRGGRASPSRRFCCWPWGGWLGGIVRGFGWPGQFVGAGFQRRDLFMGRGELRQQRQDQRVLLFVAQAGLTWRGHPVVRI